MNREKVTEALKHAKKQVRQQEIDSTSYHFYLGQVDVLEALLWSWPEDKPEPKWTAAFVRGYSEWWIKEFWLIENENGHNIAIVFSEEDTELICAAKEASINREEVN